MKPKHQRLLTLCAGFLGLSLAVFLISLAFRDNLVFFYTPSELSNKTIHPEQRLRVGGLVALNSVVQEGEAISFDISDDLKSIKVTYKGLLPDLFREGHSVVVEGYLLKPDTFQAEMVLAKHDETYMPKEVANHLKKQDPSHDAR